jgi:hypothetical protein
VVSINSDDETIVSRHFNYDYSTHLIIGDDLIKFNDEYLTSEETLKMRHCLLSGIGWADIVNPTK